MWTVAAEIPDAYIIAVLVVVLPSLFAIVAWCFNRIQSHDRDLAVMQERLTNQAQDIIDLRARRD